MGPPGNGRMPSAPTENFGPPSGAHWGQPTYSPSSIPGCSLQSRDRPYSFSIYGFLCALIILRPPEKSQGAKHAENQREKITRSLWNILVSRKTPKPVNTRLAPTAVRIKAGAGEKAKMPTIHWTLL